MGSPGKVSAYYSVKHGNGILSTCHMMLSKSVSNTQFNLYVLFINYIRRGMS